MSGSLWRQRCVLLPVLLVSLHATLPRRGAAVEGNPLPATVERIDALLADHWRKHDLATAELADDATWLRRVTLDLAGRIPTPREVQDFQANKAADKHAQAVQRLVDGPEFWLHFGSVFDEWIQGRYAGHDPFVDYLRRALREGRSWDRLFRELMLGPWTGESQVANRFLDKRAKDLDALTVDVSRVFFGVDISCAKCHDHPLVDDWKQDHYYGMAAFLNRTTGGKGTVGEKADGEVTFQVHGGGQKTAAMMFLSGRPAVEPAASEAKKVPKASRRERLVEMALEEKTFFSRALANRLWEHFFDRGLVHPVDQIHSGNPPSVPGLLEFLGEEFAAGGYDVRRLAAAIASSRAYRLSSVWGSAAASPSEGDFAVFRLRPLSRRQMAVSLVLATGDGALEPPGDTTARAERYLGVTGLGRIEQVLAWERQGRLLADHLDPRRADFRSSVGESLFLSNHEAPHGLLAAGEGRLVTRLLATSAPEQAIRLAVWSAYGRSATDAEVKSLGDWLASRKDDRTAVYQDLLWALLTAAEFRFQH